MDLKLLLPKLFLAVCFLIVFIGIGAVIGAILYPKSNMPLTNLPATSFEEKSGLEPISGNDFIATDNYANKRLEYYYYMPREVIKNRKTRQALIVVPPLSGRGESFVTVEFKKFADEEGFVIVAPSFVWDEKNWETRQSYQYPAVWSGDALIGIMDKFEKDNNIRISKLNLFGFSAGAQFALRFCLWKPEMCAASISHGAGGTIVPDRRIETKFFVTVGNQDIERIQKAKEFYSIAQSYGIDVKYKEYNTGHFLTGEQIKDSIDFLKRIKNL